MPRREPGSWLSRLVGGCFLLLAGAVAVYYAVQLIEAVAVPLLIMAGLVIAGAIGVRLWRLRSQRW